MTKLLLFLAYLTLIGACWYLAPWLDGCDDLTEGTDAYHECMTGEPIDLTPRKES